MRFIAVAFFALSVTSVATGDMIAVSNPGFEDLVLSGPGGAGNFALDNIPSWTVTSVPNQTATFKPGTAQFPGGVPEGVNVAAVGNTTTGSISQSLAALLAANTTYTLMVDVGVRLDFPSSSYLIELIANGVTLASDSSLNPAAGTFLTDTISYSSDSNPAQLGQNLEIRLSSTSPNGGQVDYDDVRLSASLNSVPEPSSLSVVGLSAFFLLIYGRFRRAAADPQSGSVEKMDR
jgi:hypothetical protein